MALKPTFHFSVSPQNVAAHAAHEFREFIHPERLAPATYTVIAYPGMRGESSSIVSSKAISRALSRATARGEPIVAIAHNFTVEALEMLQAHGAVAFRRSDYFWSDESHTAITQ